jgi:hypothetical protein
LKPGTSAAAGWAIAGAPASSKVQAAISRFRMAALGLIVNACR